MLTPNKNNQFHPSYTFSTFQFFQTSPSLILTSKMFLHPLQNEPIPGPLPLGVAVIDSSVKLYGVVFPHVAHKHRFQMLQHFTECIRQAKGPRQQAVQMNVFTAVLCALKVFNTLINLFLYTAFLILSSVSFSV